MTISNIALLFLPVAIAGGHNVADPPTAHSPVNLSAVSDPYTGRTAFSFQGKQEAPVIRANPGDSIDITLRNEMSANPNSKCATGVLHEHDESPFSRTACIAPRAAGRRPFHDGDAGRVAPIQS